MPSWDDPDDPAWKSLAAHGMSSASLMQLGDATYGPGDGLTVGQRIDRGVAALDERGYVLGGPMSQPVEAGVVVYTFVPRLPLRDPVTRWGARLIIVAVAAFALWHALQVLRFLLFVVS